MERYDPSEGLSVDKTASPVYEVRVRGHLSLRRLSSFESLTIAHHPNGDTSLVGAFRDQAALYGLLDHISSLGVALLSVNPVAVTDGEQAS